mmetsp:Transcript_45404/g.67426  ORF Transcript_45404/g.67426 Transcript_45404/m.67426 type:complete len:327 (-) Transcript_45404:2572-3552(-)
MKRGSSRVLRPQVTKSTRIVAASETVIHDCTMNTSIRMVGSQLSYDHVPSGINRHIDTHVDTDKLTHGLCRRRKTVEQDRIRRRSIAAEVKAFHLNGQATSCIHRRTSASRLKLREATRTDTAIGINSVPVRIKLRKALTLRSTIRSVYDRPDRTVEHVELVLIAHGYRVPHILFNNELSSTGGSKSILDVGHCHGLAREKLSPSKAVGKNIHTSIGMHSHGLDDKRVRYWWCEVGQSIAHVRRTIVESRNVVSRIIENHFRRKLVLQFVVPIPISFSSCSIVRGVVIVTSRNEIQEALFWRTIGRESQGSTRGLRIRTACVGRKG